MRRIIFILILIPIFCLSCNKKTENSQHLKWQDILTRDIDIIVPSTRVPLYRVKVPTKWETREFPTYANNFDTTKPLVEYFFDEIHITVHNFPKRRREDGIPPRAQIQRWLQQFDQLEEQNIQITSHAHGGFWGFMLLAEGIRSGKNSTTFAWAMQLDVEHDENLLNNPFSHHPFIHQMRADWTIKAVGPPDKMRVHQNELFNFARSFELIHEIPS